MTNVNGSLENEARGDFSGLKGTYYHIAYAAYQLLTRQAKAISFYAGNDLLAAPPSAMPDDSSSVLRSKVGEADVWIQLKNTADEHAWTVGALLSDDTLVDNLILNAIRSQTESRTWGVSLVTPSIIRSSQIRAFVANPSDKPKNEALLIDKVNAISAAASVPVVEVRRIALAVLSQIADCGRTAYSTLEDQIKIALLRRPYSDAAAKKVALAIRGSILSVGMAESAAPREITLSWLEEKTGYDLLPHDLLVADPASACDSQVQLILPENWSSDLAASRPEIDRAITAFIGSDRTVFVLVGGSGAGKTWVTYIHATHSLRGRIRAWISGASLQNLPSIAAIVANALRRFAPAESTDEEVLRTLTMNSPHLGNVTVFIDDLPMPQDPEGFCRYLTDLVAEASNRGVKLVFTARRSVWDRITSGVRLQLLFRHRRYAGEEPSFSLEVPPLTDGELREFVTRSVPASEVAETLSLVRMPCNSALRNPYLLSLWMGYRELRATSVRRQRIDVDGLLDEDIQRRFSEVGRRIGIDEAEIRAMSDALAELVWHRRRDGATTSEMIGSLDRAVPHLGRDALRALQFSDVIAGAQNPRGSAGYHQFANPQFGERLIARWLTSDADRWETHVPKLEPGLDDGLVVSLLRGPIDVMVSDVVAWGSDLCRNDPRWIASVTAGFSQRAEDSYEVISAIVALGNDPAHGALWHAMAALGGMTAWSARSRAAVASLYFDENRTQQLKGEWAMGAALNVQPAWATRQIKLRLRREVRRKAEWSSHDHQRCAAAIKGALSPLQHANTPEAAAPIGSVLAWMERNYRPRLPIASEDVRESIAGAIDDVRGTYAAHGPAEVLARIVEELASEDPVTRARAVRCLLPIAHDRPELVRDAVLQRNRVVPIISPHHLRPLWHYTDSDPEDVLRILSVEGALDGAGCGTGLALLGRLARYRAEIVGSVLPRKLSDAIPANWRAMLAGPQAFAWWQQAAHSRDPSIGRAALERLTLQEDSVDPKWQAFAAHSASVACLARIALDLDTVASAIDDEALCFHDYAIEMGADVTYSDFLNTRRFAGRIVGHALAPVLIGLLVDTVTKSFDHLIHPADGPPSEWQFRVANVATDVLADLAIQMDDPSWFILQLPPDWPTLRVCAKLLSVGKLSPDLIAYSSKICAEKVNFAGNISSDRDKLVADLKHAGKLPEENSSLGSNGGLLTESAVAMAEALTRREPNSVLEVLHASVNPQNAIPFLWDWSCDARDWRSVLLGHVMRRPFRAQPPGQAECAAICDQVLVVAGEDSASPLVREYRYVYGQLAAFVRRLEPNAPPIASTFGGDVLCESHSSTLTVIDAFLSSRGRLNHSWFRRFIAEATGWIDDPYHCVRDGGISFGCGFKTVSAYFPPALLIAITTAARGCGADDFISKWTSEQSLMIATLQGGSCQLALSDQLMSVSEADRERYLTSALAELDGALASAPEITELWERRGYALLSLGRFAEAENDLERALSLPTHRLGTRRSAHYNLACARARLGKYASCEAELRAALALNGRISQSQELSRTVLSQDPDFSCVLGFSWFQDILATLSE